MAESETAAAPATETHEASCCCGQLKLAIAGPLPGGSICHCFQCQKRTGSAFGLQARFAEDRVTIEGESTSFVRHGEGEVTLHFCPKCGSTVYWELDGLPGNVIVAIGACAKPDWPAPTFSVYEARQHPWLQLPDTVTTHWD